MVLDENFFEFIKLLDKHEVAYVLVGGWAVIFYGYARTTGDMDILVRPSAENAEKIMIVLNEFWGSSLSFVKEDFEKEEQVLMMGRPPLRIDLLTSIAGVSFDEVYSTSNMFYEDGINIRCIHINELIRNKEASGRAKDIADAEILKKIREKRNNQ